MNLCLRNVSNLLDLEYIFLLENAVCPFKMYRHGASQVSTKKVIWQFSGDYQAKRWMVGRYGIAPAVSSRLGLAVSFRKLTHAHTALRFEGGGVYENR